MENLNLGAILRHGPHSERDGNSEDSYSTTVFSQSEPAQTQCGPRSPSYKSEVQAQHHPHHRHHHRVASTDSDEELATLGRSDTASMQVPETLRDPRFDPHDDSASIRRYWDALFYPEVYMPIFYALRITLLVALPLGILARHPKTMGIFPAHVVLPLWGVVDCKYTFGEQLAQSIVSYQVGIWMGLWGGLNNIWNLLPHRSAWWCASLFGCFGMSLLGDVRAKRLLVLQTVMILQMENLPNGTDLDYPIRVGRDMIMATTFALLQVLFPLRSIAHECDKLGAKAWRNTFHILRTATRACWADDPIDRALALADCSTEPLQNFFNVINGKLFFIMYEFWESTLRLELRRERVEVLKNMVTRIHALTDTSRTLVTNRAFNIMKGKEGLHAKAEQPPQKPSAVPSRRGTVGGGARRMQAKSAPPSPVFRDDNEGSQSTRASVDGDTHYPYGRPGSRVYDADGYPCEEDDACDTKGSEVPPSSTAARAISNDMELWNRTKEILRDPLENFFIALNDVCEGLGQHLNPEDVAKHVPFQSLREASQDLLESLNHIHFEVLIKGNKEVDPMQYTTTIFFHLMLVETAQVLLDYGDLMLNFDRSRYKSQWVRLWEFFIYDYWKNFWIELPNRITLATPRDVRILKDAIKMACAYGVGVMFTEYIDTENIYYFGMAILMGVGWPTAGDTMVASVYRVTGMALACSIAYVAVWHSNNLTQELAIALAGVFIALIFRDQPPYSHTAQYCSMLVITALNSANTKLVLLSRIVGNSFTVMTYYAIVVFMFPTDVLKVTFATEVCAIDSIAKRFSRLVSVMQNPLRFDDPDHLDAVQTEIKLIGAMRDPMWGQLMTLGGWLPKAANEPTVRGDPYPIGRMRDVFSSLRRLASATDVLHSAVTLLFRTRMSGALPTALDMYSGLLPLLRKVDRRGRQVLSDFINASSHPYEWSATQATRNLSRFLALNDDLHRVFNDSHQRHTIALREHFRNSVVNRTFAHAARTLMANPQSFAGPPASARGGSSSSNAPAGDALMMHENASFASRQQLQQVLQQQQQQQGQQQGQQQDDRPVFSATEMVNYLGQQSPASARSQPMLAVSPGGVNAEQAGSFASHASNETGIEALDDPSKEPVSREVAQKLMTSFAFPARQREGSVDYLPRPQSDHPMADPLGGVHAPYGRSGTASEADTTSNLEAALRPIQEQAEEEEYRAFIEESVQNREDFSLRSDVNKVITILVATDMFFCEAERLAKNMYAINAYARTRVTPPEWYKAQMQK